MYKHVFRYKTAIIPAHCQRFWGSYTCVLSKTTLNQHTVRHYVFVFRAFQIKFTSNGLSKLTIHCLLAFHIIFYKHLLSTLFQNKRMPFYQFGDILFLQPIPTDDWKPFIRHKFEEKGIDIPDELIERICSTVQNQSSYVQQLASNVMLNAGNVVTEQTLEAAIEDLLNQNSLLFLQQLEGLTAYQMNFLKALAHGIHSNFGSKEVLENYDLGSKSNVSKIKSILTQKELIENTVEGIVFSDPVFQLWFNKEWGK